MKIYDYFQYLSRYRSNKNFIIALSHAAERNYLFVMILLHNQWFQYVLHWKYVEGEGK